MHLTASHPTQVIAPRTAGAIQTADTSGSNTINLTQQFLAEMLGVRRTSVTEVANKVQRTGAIEYSRGEIQILDRQKLERRRPGSMSLATPHLQIA
ncbi:Crp/Fnr family transcriptional regulator [Bradyrhizobium sp. JYMT SZCCT0428]|uniref:Crp/Fnr family transcriptional regulator n=1 Tax=Bradyrhizobium sp. JYMT SZCCT0428 TaxID=2807673 RepID=UPI00390898B8